MRKANCAWPKSRTAAKQAIRTQVAHMKEGWTPEMGKLVVIGHGDCPDDVEQLRQAVLKEFPDADIRVAYIGRSSARTPAPACWR